MIERDIETIDLDSDEDSSIKDTAGTPVATQMQVMRPYVVKWPPDSAPLMPPLESTNKSPTPEDSHSTDGWEKRCQIFVHPQEASGPIPSTSAAQSSGSEFCSGSFSGKFEQESVGDYPLSIKIVPVIDNMCSEIIEKVNNTVGDSILQSRYDVIDSASDLSSGSTDVGADSMAVLRNLDPSKVQAMITFEDDDDDDDSKLVVDMGVSDSDVAVGGGRGDGVLVGGGRGDGIPVGGERGDGVTVGGGTDAGPAHARTQNKILLEDFINNAMCVDDGTKIRNYTRTESMDLTVVGEGEESSGGGRVGEDTMGQYAPLERQEIWEEEGDQDEVGVGELVFLLIPTS